jgi:hypothetical protein
MKKLIILITILAFNFANAQYKISISANTIELRETVSGKLVKKIGGITSVSREDDSFKVQGSGYINSIYYSILDSVSLDGTNYTAKGTYDFVLNQLTTIVAVPAGGGNSNSSATSANQVIGNASLSSIDTKTPALVSGRVPVDNSPTAISDGATSATKATVKSGAVSATGTDNAIVVTMHPNSFSTNGSSTISDGVTASTKVAVKASNTPPTAIDPAMVVTISPNNYSRNVSQLNTAYSALNFGKGAYDEFGRQLVNTSSPQTSARAIHGVSASGRICFPAVAGQRFVITGVQIANTSSTVQVGNITFGGLDPSRTLYSSGTNPSLDSQFTLWSNGAAGGCIYIDLSSNPIFGAINTAIMASTVSNCTCAVFGYYQVG